jgi:hypothetical protein
VAREADGRGPAWWATPGAEGLQTSVGDAVKEGTVVRTDGLKSYKGLDAV